MGSLEPLTLGALLLTACFLLGACAPREASNADDPLRQQKVTVDSSSEQRKAQSPVEAIDNIQRGGLYVVSDGEHRHGLVKVLAVDDGVVHLRLYKEEFSEFPQGISSSTLTLLIGHAPFDAEGFLLRRPVLIEVETVREDELDGYRIYQEQMSEQNWKRPLFEQSQIKFSTETGVLHDCYMAGLKDDPDLQGVVTVQMSLAASGNIEEVSLVSSTLTHESTTSCILNEVRQLTFERSKDDPGDVLSLTIPLRFNSEGIETP